MNTVNVYGQPNPESWIIYNSGIGLLAEAKRLVVIDSNCPKHIDTIANFLGNYGYQIIAVVPTSNGSEVYMTNK